MRAQPVHPRPRRSLRGPIALVSVAASLALALAGCGGGSGSGAKKLDTAAPVTLTWWTGQTEEAEKLLVKLAVEFHKAHPNVTINVSSGAPTTDDLLQKLSATFATGKYPDISYAYGSWAGQLGGSGKTLDFTDKVKAPAVGWSELPPAARLTATPGGTVIGFPAVVDNLALIYNKKLFDAAGVAYPTDQWTWDDFRNAAKKINDPAKKIYGTAWSVSGSEDTTWHLWPMLWQNGGQILSADGKKSAFASKAGVDSLELLRTMAVDDKTMYLDQTDEKYGPLFEGGHVGMMISGPWEIYPMTQAKTPYGVTILPGTNGDHETISGPDIWAAFDHKDANRAYWTFQLLNWMSRPDQDARWSMGMGNLPLRTSEQGTPAYAAFVKDFPGVDVLVANLANAKKARPTIKQYPEVSRYVGTAVAKVMQGRGTAQQALTDAAKRADQALSFG